jgi:hypothetical protein
MYDSLPAMYKGWTRIYYGAFKTVRWLLAVMALTLLFTLAPFLALAATAAATAAGDARPLTAGLFALSLLTTIVIFITMRRYCAAGRASPWYLVYYPLMVVLVMAFQAGAIVRALGLTGVTWRGTTYRGGRVVAGGGK